MRLLVCIATLITATSSARAEFGWYDEGGLGKAYTSGGLDAFEDGAFAVRAALGMRGKRWGGELFLTKAELGDGTDFYDAFTFGPMLTARHVIARKQLDGSSIFDNRLEAYARMGPTYTVMLGDPGEGPADGVSGFGFTTGGGLRWVYTAVAFSLDVTFVRVNLHREAHHDLGDELHMMDTSAFDLEGNLLAVTLGFGFAL